jgi:TonB family protein
MTYRLFTKAGVIAVSLLPVSLIGQQPQLGWRAATASSNWSADSTICERRARLIAGVDTGSTVRKEFGSCLGRMQWDPVRRYSVPPDCRIFDLQWIDAAPSDSVVIARWTPRIQRRLQELGFVTSDRLEQRRLAFELYRGNLLFRVRSVGGAGDRLVNRITEVLMQRVSAAEPLELQRSDHPTNLEAVLTFRGECISEIEIHVTEDDYAVLLHGRPIDAPVYFEFQVERQATRLRSSPAARYPDMLRSAKVEGEVLAQFVVDTTGVVDSTSIKILRSSHELFSQSVRQAVLSGRYSPAMLNGRKVRQLIQEPFNFTITR